MDCLTAQTKITSYVEGMLSGDELKEFLLHIQKCPGCKEELEIYYTLLEATRQLDEGIISTSNFTQELDNKIKKDLQTIISNENWTIRVNFISTIFIFAFLCLTAIALFDIPIPFFQSEPTWEEQKIHIEETMIPYMFEQTLDIERLEIE